MSDPRTAEQRITEFQKTMMAHPCWSLAPDWTLFEHENEQTMTKDEETILLIKGMISQLPAGELYACTQLVEHIEIMIREAGEPVGSLAMALVGAKAQARNPL